MEKLETCPICGGKMSGEYNLCSSCGWISFVFPAEIPDKLKEMEEKRLEAAKAAFAKAQSPKAESKTTNSDKKVTNSEKACGFVVFKNRETCEECACVIYDGYNTYGADKEDGLHHEIKMELFDFAPKHFSIDTSGHKGWIIKDLVGNSLKTKTGAIPYNGIYAGNSLGIILINNTIEVKIVKL